MSHPAVAAESLKVLALIPARGGSKGIPRKNLAPLGGKPLIHWTLDSALRAALVSRVAVSTDDDDIAQVARAAGAGVIPRPTELAGDTAHTDPVLEHALEYLQREEAYRPDVILLLQCTSPLRGASVMDEAIRLLADSGCDCVLTVCHVQNSHVSGHLSPEGLWEPRYRYGERIFSQNVRTLYTENGSLWALRREVLETHHNRLGGEVRALVMDWAHSVDIDTPEDLWLTERLLEALGPPQ